MGEARRLRAYYAAGLFNEGERAFNLRAKAVLDDLGYETWFPQSDAGFLEDYIEQGMTLEQARDAIFRKNIAAVEAADVLVFNLDGRVPDEGACIEAGVAYGKSKKIIGLQTDFRAVEPGGNNLMIDGILEYRIAQDLDELREMLTPVQPAPALDASIDLRSVDRVSIDLRPARPYVAVSGPIGVGKTALVTLMTQRGTWHALDEPVDENPYLTEVYANLADLGFRMQTYYLAQRARQHAATASITGPVVQERCIQEDGLVFFDAYHAAGAYDANDLATLMSLYDALASRVPQPDAIVVPWASFDVTLERIRERGRIAEQDIDRGFLRGVYDRYETWLVDFSEIPIVTIDSEALDYAHSPEDQAATMRIVTDALEGVGLAV